ncbi:helix-turn-helix domain-containing protein [Cohnella nanjingensis]|uniref:Helix-turn-helix domain-containing protein n=1 Tax=Cohnella nanjingensis TaxID=1387779 RepID=A0A7X0VFL1_9BACL|nr:helix-turn-helix domain-containing protein [Cohnella nanjingensis]
MGQSEDSRIGDLIKLLLKKHSLSMRKLGNLCGMDAATISRIVNGKQQPKLSHLRLFAEHLHVPLEQLIRASGSADEDDRNDRGAKVMDSLDAIRGTLGDSRLFDPEATTALIEQELLKYEQYARTEEGHRMICLEFDAKVSQVNGVGPFIEHLKEMHARYRDEDTPDSVRAVLGSGLLYFILSADIIPDYLFPIGYLDDAIAVHLVLDRLNRKGSA